MLAVRLVTDSAGVVLVDGFGIKLDAAGSFVRAGRRVRVAEGLSILVMAGFKSTSIQLTKRIDMDPYVTVC